MKDLKFTTKLDIDIEYSAVAPTGYTFESHSTEAKIEYTVDFEVREYGIKEILFFCFDQEVECYIELTDSEGDSDSHLVTLKLTNNGVCYEGFSTISLSPSSAELTITKFTKVGKSFVAEGSIDLKFDE